MSLYEASGFASANLLPLHPNSILCGIYLVIVIRNSNLFIPSYIHSFKYSSIHESTQLTACVLRLSTVGHPVSPHSVFPVNKRRGARPGDMGLRVSVLLGKTICWIDAIMGVCVGMVE